MTKSQILLVDDDVLTGKLIEFVLTDAGYGMRTLADPRRVMIVLGAHPVDLILLDITLPHLDGYTVARQVRREYPEIPLTASVARTMPTMSAIAERGKIVRRVRTARTCWKAKAATISATISTSGMR